MLYLKFYKPLNGLHVKLFKKKVPLFAVLKINKKYFEFNSIHNYYNRFSTKVCFFTFKYKTQLNVLHMSRHTLRSSLTFNKDHSWVKHVK